MKRSPRRSKKPAALSRRSHSGHQPNGSNIQTRLLEAEETLRAIRSGQIDAVVVQTPKGDQVFTLKGADYTYRVLVENMSEGAAILSGQGIIIYCNRRFAEMVRAPLEEVMSLPMAQFVSPATQLPFQELMQECRNGLKCKREVALRARDGNSVPAYFSSHPLGSNGIEGICIIATDLTLEKQNHERVLRLSHRLLEIQEAERRHLARELHDEIGQLLTSLKLSFATSHFLPPDLLPNHLHKVGEDVDHLIKRVQDISLDLRPGMLDDLGLLPALLWHFKRFTEQTSVQVAFEHSGLQRKRFAPRVETAAYRIVQESLTNVARHAAVNSAEVRLIVTETFLHIEVIDHGAGFDAASALAHPESSGLSGMQERAALLAGSLRVESQPGAGTRVRALLPMSS